ncbi:unnamed protein product, partial [Owenia fusiformis]
PSIDHTYGTAEGYFMVAESASKPNSRARLISPTFTTGNTDQCFEFWLHMYGSNSQMGRLNVYMGAYEKSKLSLRSRVWSAGGNNGNTWFRVQIPIPAATSSNMVFESVFGPGTRSQMAFDDVKVLKTSCPFTGDCDFENGICGWTHFQDGTQFDWTLGRGSTKSTGTGASVDHTFGNSSGTYLFIESSAPRKKGDVAKVISPMFQSTSIKGKCIRWWYHMYGRELG